MARVRKDVSFGYNIRGKIDKLEVKVPLMNRHFERLEYCSPRGRESSDEFGNVYMEYEMDFPEDFTVEYEVEVKKKPRLPDSIFRRFDEIKDSYTIPPYDIDQAARKFRNSGRPVSELGQFIRENYSFPRCEHASMMAVQVGDRLGHKVAHINGYVPPYEELHGWALVDDGSHYHICDAAIPPKGEKRFVRQLNRNNGPSTRYRYHGSAEISASNHDYVQFDSDESRRTNSHGTSELDSVLMKILSDMGNRRSPILEDLSKKVEEMDREIENARRLHGSRRREKYATLKRQKDEMLDMVRGLKEYGF